MYIVLLKPGAGRERAAQFMAGHRSWLETGLDEGAFLLWGSLKPGGGAILARADSQAELETRLAADPFIAEQVVSVEIIALAPARAVEQLAFLLD